MDRRKRTFDIVVGTISLILATPVMLAVAVAAYVSLGPPILFRQERIGRHGRTFSILKFRTMHPDRRGARGSRVGPDRRLTHKTDADPRHTKLGRFLRTYSFDELPQLINVVRGEMSLVGPRPEIVEVARRAGFVDHVRHTVKPGITGLWQVSGPESCIIADGLRYDEAYVESRSLNADLKILFRTPWAVLSRKGTLREVRLRRKASGGNSSTGHPSLKIAMIGSRGVPAQYSGIENVIEVVGRGLVESGHSVTVYCWRTDGPRPAQHEGMRLLYLPAIGGTGVATAVNSFLSTIHAILSGYDVIHFHALGPGLMSVLARPLTRARVVVTVHGRDDKRKKWGPAARTVLRLGAWVSAHVPHETLVVSKALQQEYHENYRRQTVLVPNSVAPRVDVVPGRTLERLGLHAGHYSVSVGRLVPEKRIDLLISGYRRSALDLPLLIIGDSAGTNGYHTRLRAMGANDERIRFLGPVYGDELAEILSSATLFVTTSELEGLPTALLEAILHGVSVVATDIPPHREIFGDDGAGHRLVRNFDPDTLAGVLEQTVKERPVAHTEVRRLAHDLRDRFSPARAVEVTERVYLGPNGHCHNGAALRNRAGEGNR